MGSYQNTWWNAGLLLLGIASVSGLDNGLGLRPPMGYNSWNHLKCDGMNEKAIMSVADAMVSKGLLAAGYEYLNLDDCWVAADRDASGRLQGNADKFPSGMRAIGDYIHSKGLKFGIYTDRGTKTCAAVGPGSKNNEKLDAQTFADWGVDFVKEDNCYNGGHMWGPEDKDQLFNEFALFRDGLNATGRPIFFSVCGGGWNAPWINDLTYYATDPRGAGKLGNSWRVTADCVGWSTCQLSMNTAADLSAYGGEGGFNDPDMLLGSSKTAAAYLSNVQSRTQFNVWAVLMAPLLIGAPVNAWSDNHWDLTTYLNEEVIAVNQDPSMHQGFKAAESKSLLFNIWRLQVWVRRLSEGAIALVFVNTYPWSETVTCDSSCWTKLASAQGAEYSVRDLWSHGEATVPIARAGEDYAVQVGANGASKMFKLTRMSWPPSQALSKPPAVTLIL